MDPGGAFVGSDRHAVAGSGRVTRRVLVDRDGVAEHLGLLNGYGTGGGDVVGPVDIDAAVRGDVVTGDGDKVASRRWVSDCDVFVRASAVTRGSHNCVGCIHSSVVIRVIHQEQVSILSSGHDQLHVQVGSIGL